MIPEIELYSHKNVSKHKTQAMPEGHDQNVRLEAFYYTSVHQKNRKEEKVGIQEVECVLIVPGCLQVCHGS